MGSQLTKTKGLDLLMQDIEAPQGSLKRVLGPIDLVALGVGAIIGAGIFVTIGTAAAGSANRPGAGPAIIISFLLVAVACGFAALCYAEFASMIPIAGSAYTYAYATLGELTAWIIGWDLIIEYAVGNVAVAIGWSGYFQELLAGFGIHIPRWLATDYRTAHKSAEILASAPRLFDIPIIINIPAALIVVGITWVLVIGIKESSRFNSVLVALKILILVFFVVVGYFYVKPANWHPFAPGGWAGIQTGAALVFFAYIGFDAVSTAAEETKNPKRDLPIGMIGSLVICTILYIAVAVVLTGMVPFKMLDTAEPLATALNAVQLQSMAGLISLGAVIATTAVLLVFQMGQPRIFFSMARDGLLPKRFSAVHPRFKTPHVTTILTGAAVAAFAAFANIDEVVELTNIGTLFAFVLVCAGIIVLRYKEPDRPRGFRCPLVPWVPLAGIASCVYLMFGLPWVTWLRFVVWLAAGLIIYFSYGFWRSRLRAQ